MSPATGYCGDDFYRLRSATNSVTAQKEKMVCFHMLSWL